MKQRVSLLAVVSALLIAVLGLCGCAQVSELSSSLFGKPYTPEKLQPTVSTPTIGKEGVLRVGVDASNAPYSTQVSGKLAGIDVDMAAALAAQMGLSLELVDVGSDAEGALKAGTVDVVMSMDSSDSSSSYWLSDPYLQTCVALFSKGQASSVPSASSSVSIEAQAASMSAWEVSNQFGDEALKTVPDLKTAFSDLNDGKVDYVAADAVIGVYITHTTHSDVHITALMQKVSGRSIGVLSSNDELKKAVSDALDAINSGGIGSIIEAKWLGSALSLDQYSQTATAQRASSKTSGTASSTNSAASSSTTESSSDSSSGTSTSSTEATTSSDSSNSGSATANPNSSLAA
ncbi:periplasmic component of amino acid ABC-type transporter/signal transduction system [Cryptobacterium curtum DSM 15641]|uniref:Periplasmic component of amino acid ABC-type transporter/signal transduction system n=1 Tax=Cryptobacterium curtum (strain ATCC 700683 / DSM 15641 / CCUG 43107 / 12-3) TaxID=469378 RepID=C7MKX7_CRYCD|nr:transporter substrate-binding domain-containing protein [Cryptobacterium curtum]ACU94924.1 periplasmic component of amino acid ABC-type transporter/signal transduction system [Cryptobacterium curtum DSM 15641]